MTHTETQSTRTAVTHWPDGLTEISIHNGSKGGIRLTIRGAIVVREQFERGVPWLVNADARRQLAIERIEQAEGWSDCGRVARA